MMNTRQFHKILTDAGLDFFVGVADSTLKEWLAIVCREANHLSAVNECEALAIASGYYLGSSKPACVYLQNAGLGKIVNPLTSLTDSSVFRIPSLLIIGWRGEPGINDAPQHIKMGEITLPLLELLGVKYVIVDSKKIFEQITEAMAYIKQHELPFALIIRKGFFEKEEGYFGEESGLLSREEVIKILLSELDASSCLIATTGKTSRELCALREARGEVLHDFPVVGSMGCASGIALGLSVARPHKKIVIFDGDGAALMQMGTIASIGHTKPKYLLHIIFDNGVYESTGAQPTISETVDFASVAHACGYNSCLTVDNEENIRNSVRLLEEAYPRMIVIKVKTGSRKDLERPEQGMAEIKRSFQKHVQGESL